ncbi:hypothetical protein GCM10007898_07040 [Dyella flagellata]|uniref:Uncharacterized protein n=1 Tax=Dyella flagellata TaxID=1867833 RepID=A0ABQ5X6D7_9GAMM|nr:hypothetical protein GCM10007898_07040 [Dyella flagellata]
MNIPRDAYPDARAFLSSIKRYPYVASMERAARITAGAKELRRCMTKGEVGASLGAPDYAEVSYGPKGPNARWLGSSWVFYISKRSDDVNLNDPRLEVFFDTANRAQWIVPAGIEGVNVLGAPNFVCPSSG